MGLSQVLDYLTGFFFRRMFDGAGRAYSVTARTEHYAVVWVFHDGPFFYFFFFNFIALLHNMDNYKYSPPKPELVEVNLCSAIPQLVATINVSNNVQAMAECDNELPKVKLDITFLKRILVNQTTNAIQAMTDGGQSTRFPSLFRDLSTKLEAFKVARHQISRRVLRMNKRLEKEFGERIAEKRGWHWALTSFTVEAIGETESPK
ncbi:MAG: hypothetical protein ABSB10_04130 [Candidatus Bathyarchaeia archaeon]